MTTLSPPTTKKFPEDSLERKVYDAVESLSHYLPIVNDRNRLAFSLYKYLIGEGDSPAVLLQSTKVKVVDISRKELAEKVESKINNLKR